MSYSNDNDIKLSAKVSNEKEVTLEFIINEATEIFHKVRDNKYDISDEKAAEEMLNRLRAEHKDFNISYPLVVRYAAQMRSYSIEAFKKYLGYLKHHPWKTEHDFLDSQAEYVVLLYKAKHKKWNATQINNLRANTRTILRQEHDDFKKTLDKYKTDVDEEYKALTKERLAELKQWYDENKDSIDDMHLRAEIDAALQTKGEEFDAAAFQQKLIDMDKETASSTSIAEAFEL